VIAADHWHDNGDGTAWMVAAEPHAAALSAALVCEKCGGDGVALEGGDDHDCRDCVDGCFVECCDCDGTGRHTFAVEVSFGPMTRGARIHRVHVAPGVVLPIVNYGEHSIVGRYVATNVESPAFYFVQNEEFPVSSERITLPPAAKPGMWAVLLQLHEVDR
jgi:hypothetical protein